MTTDTVEISIFKRTLKLAVPAAASRFIAVFAIFSGMAMVAHLGHHALAASALMLPAQTTLTVISMSIIFSTSAVIGRAYGAKQHHLIGCILRQAWLLALIVSIPMMFIGKHMYVILAYFHQEPDLIKMVQQYFDVTLWSYPFLMINATCAQAFYGILKQKMVMKFALISTIINIITAYGFIFGKLGFPHCGIAGLGYATIIQMLAGCMMYFGVIAFKAEFKPYNFLKRIPSPHRCMKQLLSIGLPISLQTGAELLYFLTVTMMTGWLGNEALGANQITRQYMFLLVVPIFSLSQAAGVLVSQSYGRKEFSAIPKFGNASLQLAFFLVTVVGGLYVFMPHQLARLFIDISDPKNQHILYLASWLFVIAVTYEFFDAVRNVLTGALRGLYDTKYAMMVSVLGIWCVSLPCAYYFAFHLHWGVIGIALGTSTGILLGMILMISRWHSQLAKVLAMDHGKKAFG